MMDQGNGEDRGRRRDESGAREKVIKSGKV